MAVLAEAISVVIRRKAIDKKFPGGWNDFVEDVPNQTLCADDKLARFGFMSPQDAKVYVGYLEGFGFRYLVRGKAIDLAVVDQQLGPMVKCKWLEFGNVNLNENPETRVAACRVKWRRGEVFRTPEGWKYEGSLSQTFGFVPMGQEDKSLKFLRHENGVDVYLNTLTGKETYIGRTGIRGRPVEKYLSRKEDGRLVTGL